MSVEQVSRLLTECGFKASQKTVYSWENGNSRHGLSNITENVSKYVKERGINISKMARDTGLSYSALYSSLIVADRKRDLRDYEFMGVCFFLSSNQESSPGTVIGNSVPSTWDALVIISFSSLLQLIPFS